MQSPSDHSFSNHHLVFLAFYPLLFTLQKSGEKESRNEPRAPLVGPNLLCLPMQPSPWNWASGVGSKPSILPLGRTVTFRITTPLPITSFFRKVILSFHTTQQHDMRTREGKSIQRGCGSADTMSLVILFAASPRPLCVQTMGLVVGVLWAKT